MPNITTKHAITYTNTTIEISDVERVNVQRLGVGKTVHVLENTLNVFFVS